MAKAPRDVERIYSTAEAAAKLRRLADALETDQPFRIQVAGERIRVPARGAFSIEHERGEDSEEIEFQLKWTLDATVVRQRRGSGRLGLGSGDRRNRLAGRRPRPVAPPGGGAAGRSGHPSLLPREAGPRQPRPG